MRIAVINHEGSDDFYVSKIEPWASFFRVFQSAGHEIVTYRNRPDVVIFMNDHKKLRFQIIKKNPEVLLVLVIWETPTTKPNDFKKKNFSRYNLIFAPSPMLMTGPKVILFNWPQSLEVKWNESYTQWLKRKETVAFYASNKFSFARNELYSKRRKIIKNLGERVEVYGSNWNKLHFSITGLLRAFLKFSTNFPFRGMSIYQCAFVRPNKYMGTRQSKDELINYKFCLVIENDANYVSEKLFDAMSYGCVPLYMGPDLDIFGLSNNFVLRVENERLVNTIVDRALLNQIECFNKVVEAREFMCSKDALKYGNSEVLHTLASRTCDWLNEVGC